MHANHGKETGVCTAILSVVAIALGGMAGTVGLLNQIGEAGPKIGDIVSFDPTESMARDLRARITVALADKKPGSECILDVRTMHETGGSVVIEARQPQTPHGYRAHWAGRRSSNDRSDCGTSANLLLGQDDIEILAMAAGGYGASRKTLKATSLWSSSNAAQ